MSTLLLVSNSVFDVRTMFGHSLMSEHCPNIANSKTAWVLGIVSSTRAHEHGTYGITRARPKVKNPDPCSPTRARPGLAGIPHYPDSPDFPWNAILSGGLLAVYFQRRLRRAHNISLWVQGFYPYTGRLFREVDEKRNLISKQCLVIKISRILQTRL